MNKLNYKLLSYLLVVLAFASFASAGNYRFQNTSGYDLMFMNGTSRSAINILNDKGGNV